MLPSINKVVNITVTLEMFKSSVFEVFTRKSFLITNKLFQMYIQKAQNWN